MLPFGQFDFAVIGFKENGQIQIVPGYEDVCIYTKPLNFDCHNWEWMVKKATENRVLKKPFKRIVCLQKTNTWMPFKAYCYRHWWVGNHLNLRYHAFFRSIRESPTTTNIYRKGVKINYIDAKDISCWKIHNKKTEKWEPINLE